MLSMNVFGWEGYWCWLCLGWYLKGWKFNCGNVCEEFVGKDIYFRVWWWYLYCWNWCYLYVFWSIVVRVIVNGNNVCWKSDYFYVVMISRVCVYDVNWYVFLIYYRLF